MRSKAGSICMIAGAALVVSALLLLVYNRWQDNRAGDAASGIMAELQKQIGEVTAAGTHTSGLRPDIQKPGSVGERPAEMTVKEIDGYGYIGCLSIPALELELPVMSEWDYVRLRIAPCRHFGTAAGGDLVIAGHNYKRHFGRLSSLSVGDFVLFTDMDGVVYIYAVSALETLGGSAMGELESGDWDLTLYTCTYGGRSRVTVRCLRITEEAFAEQTESTR